MMQDIAMYMLDIANNALNAQAKNIKIKLDIDKREDRLSLCIEDDGVGMDEKTLMKVVDPFFTTRTTRGVGLGVAFFKALADQCDGTFTIKSKINEGTIIRVDIRNSHIDRPPLGDIVETITTLIQANSLVDYQFEYRLEDDVLVFNTKDIKEILEDININEPGVLVWIKNYLKEGINHIKEDKNEVIS